MNFNMLTQTLLAVETENVDFITVTKTLLSGFSVTCTLFALTLLFALPLGLLISFGTRSKISVIKKIFQVFVWVVRGIPLMLQLFIVYYLPGMLSDGANIFGELDDFFFFNFGISDGGAFIATLIAFVINYACYFSEIFRGGIEAIPKGQYEAGQVLGMTKGQIFSQIILLQVVKNITAPMSNEVITLVKDTALARVIGVIEIIRQAERMVSKVVWPLFYTGAFYLVFVGLFSLLFGYVEKKLSYYKV